MNSQNTDANHKPTEPSVGHANGSPPSPGHEFGRRAKAILFEFPATFEAQMKRNPYAALGVAFAVGMGTGILLGSRVLRAVLTTAAAHAALEIGRTYLRQTSAPRAVP
jgi:hypothetical protein